MKKLRALIVACLVVCSVVLVAGSAMAASVWNVIHGSVSIIDFEVKGAGAFGIFDPHNTTNAELFNYSKINKSGTGFVTLSYENNKFYYFNKTNNTKGSEFMTISSNDFAFYYDDGSSSIPSALSGTLEGDSAYSFKDERLIVDDITPSTVPIPASIFLFGTGLVGLVGLKRRKTA